MIVRFLIAAKIGVAEIFNNKMRSFLSMFAIAIGVITFLFVFSVINSSRAKVNKALELGGANSFTFDFGWERKSKVKMDMGRYNELLKKFPEAKRISPTTPGISFTTNVDNKFYDSTFLGITPEWKKSDWVYGRVKGRFITWDDILKRRKVAVFIREPVSNKDKIPMGTGSGYGFWHSGAKELKWTFYNKSMLGKKVKILGETFTVVGEVTAPRAEYDERLEKSTWDFLAPITSLGDVAWADRNFRNLKIEAASEKEIEPLKQKFISYFRLLEGDRKAQYDVRTFREKAATKLEGLRKNILLISILGAIAMISGGIGIMNVVLATIYARTKEIGTRRALGASKFDIFMQFSFESIVLSLLGAVLGYVAAVFALDKMASILNLEASLDLLSVLMAFGISALTGFLFSLYPSLKAANMNPVDALKVE